jgi:hypothetical protein
MEILATAGVVGGLIVSSAAYHMTKHRTLYYIDQGAVMALVVRSFVDGINGGADAFVITLAVNSICTYLYYYGRLTQTLIWSPNFYSATASHMLMHSISAVGYYTLLMNYKAGKI